MHSSRLSKNLNNVPDYLKDKKASEHLAQSIQDYYHAQGHTNIKCWVEAETSLAGKRKTWGIRSNIVFNLNSLA